MKSVVRIFIFLMVLLIIYPSFISAQVRQKVPVSKEVNKWITSSFAKGKIPPFSFVYEGKASSDFIRKWKHTIKQEESDDPQVIRYDVTYLDPAGELQVNCHITGFKEFQTVEWIINFKNTSSRNSGTIEQVKVLDYTAEDSGKGTSTLHYAEGSYGSRNDFRPLSSTLQEGETVHLEPQGGRSSDHTAFPFFNIELSDGKGMIAAVGWTGTWYADITRQEAAVSLSAGMQQMKLYLYPGESIRTPRICLLFWENKDRMYGHNSFRRFLLAHHSRQIDGHFAEYPLAAGFDWGDPWPCNEYGCLTEEFAIALIQRYQLFGIVPEVFWLDAGWYTGSGGPSETTNWSTVVGNWTVDKTRFPNGLKPVSDAVHRVGAKFMVWFEPERVIAGTQLATQFPEWMLKNPGDNTTFLFDLGNKDACQWLSQYIGDFIEENGIDYYRQDFNMHCRSYWDSNDEPGRTGIKEIRHIEGLYAFWDYLLDRFPNLLIDNCAAGGRRLDLETISRSAPLWRTDYQYGEANGYQCHTYGLNFFLPLHGTGLYGTDNYNFRSSLGSATVINWEITSNRGSIPEMQRVIAEYKKIRPYFYEDYYPLTGIEGLTGDEIWMAYQLNKPSDRSGIVVAFRRKDNKQNSRLVQLKGLDPDTSYQVKNENNGQVITKNGRELMEGLTLEIGEAPGSLLLKYNPAENLGD